MALNFLYVTYYSFLQENNISRICFITGTSKFVIVRMCILLQPVWLNPITPKEHSIMYDKGMCVPDIAGYEARQLMNRAYKSALTLPQQQQLLTELENDSKLVYHIGLTPTKVNI